VSRTTKGTGTSRAATSRDTSRTGTRGRAERPPAARRRRSTPARRVPRAIVAERRSTTRTGRFAAGSPRRRLIAVLVALAVLLLAVLVRVGALQTSQGANLRAAGARQWTRTREIQATRGTIFDRNGEELAMSVPASTVTVNPKLIDDPAATASILQGVLGLTDERRAELQETMADKDRGFVYVARQIDDAVGEQIDALDLVGVDVVSEDRRILPGGMTGRSVIGQTDIDGIGTAGLELQFDDVLTGSGGEETREVAPGGRSIPGTESVARPPVPGDDLILTLDRSIQFATERALIEQVEQLGARGANAIVMDTDTGELLAMASVRRNADTGVVEVASGNYAVVDADEPGSVAKVVTVAASLNEGAITPETAFEVPWRKQWYDDLLADAEQHPTEWWTAQEILVHSSNIGTMEIQQRIGRERHWEYMRAFGLGEKTALDFPGESTGIMKTPDELWGSERVTVAYGQGFASTSIQLASAINTIANDGTYVAPKLVAATVGADGTVTESAPSATHEVVSPTTAQEVQSYMMQVVCRGTAETAQIDGFTVAGKTGTGYKPQANGTYFDEAGRRVYYSSFVGFFPAEDPQATILISVDEPPAETNGRFGSQAAAPVFARLAPTIIHEQGFQPPPVTTGCAGG
jgi:cell division protein FtsI (penicillin-binding protein 3)